MRVALVTSILAACGGDSTDPPERDQVGGALTDIVQLGTLAYVTVGPRLAIWDLADPSAPVLRGETEPFDTVLQGVAVRGTYAYAIDRRERGSELRIIDVADPEHPAAAATLRLVAADELGFVTGVAIVDDALLVATERELSVYDLADPRAPRLRRTVTDVGGASELRRIGDRVYVSGPSLLGDAIVGVLDAADLAYRGRFVVPGGIGVSMTPDHLAVAVGASGTAVYDLRDLANLAAPPILYQGDVQARAVAAGAGVAWIPGPDGLHVLDLSNPAGIAERAPVDMPCEGVNAADVHDGRLAVVTDRGRLLSIDVAAPLAPVARAVVDGSLCDICLDVEIVGDDLFVAAGAGGLRTGRLRDLESVGRATPRQNTDFEDVLVVDSEQRVAYAADWFGSLRSYDVTDPATPRQLGQLDLDGNPSAIAYSGGRVYLGQATNGGVVWVIDVADPASLRVLGQVETSEAQDLAIDGNRLYVADSTLFAPGGLRIFDVSRPDAISLLGHYDACEYARSVALSGDLAVLACEDGFHVVDVHDPAAPVQRAVWAPSELHQTWSVATAGTRAYLGHDDGVAALDLADPAAPRVIAEWQTAAPVRGLAAPTPDRVIAASSSGGVYRWQVP